MPSHLITSSPARCRVVRPPGNLDRGQSFTIWLIVCFAAPPLQDGSGILRQRARFAAHCPWPVLKWFKFAHRCRGKLKPGGRAVGSSTKDCSRPTRFSLSFNVWQISGLHTSLKHVSHHLARRRARVYCYRRVVVVDAMHYGAAAHPITWPHNWQKMFTVFSVSHQALTYTVGLSGCLSVCV